MTEKKANKENRQTKFAQRTRLARLLVDWERVSQVDLAGQVEINKNNLCSWLGGRPYVIGSDTELKVLAALGWVNGRLSPDYVHRWQIGDAVGDLAWVLRLSQQDAGNPDATIIPVEIAKARFEPDIRQGKIILDIRHGTERTCVLIDRTLSDQPLTAITAESLGFGTMSEAVNIEQRHWDTWWRSPALPTAHFLEDLNRVLPVAAGGHALADEVFGADDVTAPEAPFHAEWMQRLEEAQKRGISIPDLLNELDGLIARLGRKSG